MAIKSYRYEAEVLVKEYLLADSFVPYTSVLGGIFICKMLSLSFRSLSLHRAPGGSNVDPMEAPMEISGYQPVTGFQNLGMPEDPDPSKRNPVGSDPNLSDPICSPTCHFSFTASPLNGSLQLQAYDFTHLVSSYYIKGYPSLTKIQRIEWNNRGMSSAHAIYITLTSLFLVFFSDLFSDDAPGGLIVFRSSPLSIFTLGVSVGYFITDLAMILWLYPSLGGMEYIMHHLLSVLAISYAMFSGQGQLYAFLVLISETTTPGINLRWFLDAAGMKRSKAYLVNGVAMFFSWVVARILLFVYLFYHVYQHYDQVEQMDNIAYIIVFSVPSVLAIMNTMWFGKILRGLKKTLAKRQ